MFVIGVRDGCEIDIQPQLVCLKKQVLDDGPRVGFGGDLQQHAQGEMVMDDRLSDIKNTDALVGQHVRQRCRQPGVVLSGYV